MKKGKFIPVGVYNDVKSGYGTVDHKNLKTIYIQFNSWLQPTTTDFDFDREIQRTRRNIKNYLYSLKSEYFKSQSIVDLDIKTNGIREDKRSFMDLEITLFTDRFFDVRANHIKSYVKEICEYVIDNHLIEETLFNFHQNKN